MVSSIRKSGLPFPSEAGTKRMRDVINKGMPNEDLLEVARKLYFMIGLLGERDENVVGIAANVKWLQQKCRKRGRKLVSVHLTFVNIKPMQQT